MIPYTALRVPHRILWTTDKLDQLGMQYVESTRSEPNLKADRRPRTLEKQFAPLLPYSGARELRELILASHVYADGHGFWLHRKSKTPCELHCAQYAQRIIAEQDSIRRPQNFLIEVLTAPEEIGQLSVQRVKTH